jgi:hypothetical protein
VKHGEIVLRVLFPANEDVAEAIEPGMSVLDPPAPGFSPSKARQFMDLLAPAADMSGEAELLGQRRGRGSGASTCDPCDRFRPRRGPAALAARTPRRPQPESIPDPKGSASKIADAPTPTNRGQ